MMAITTAEVRTDRVTVDRIPLGRIAAVELRKMLDTRRWLRTVSHGRLPARSGFWLIASIAIIAVMVAAGVVLFTPDAQLTYASFPDAIRIPVVVILPLVAILAVTSEWTQRSGLTTFTMIPHRRRVIAGKAVASVVIAIAAMVLTFAVGAVGNLLGAAVNGTPLVWDVTAAQGAQYGLGMVLSLLVGFMFGVLIRASTGAIVAYFIYSLLLPGLLGWLAISQQWYADMQPWTDLAFAVGTLFRFGEGLSVEQWANIGVTTTAWIVVPLLIGLRMVMRAEVK